MSIMSRMKRVTTGKLEVFLSRAENPEVVFPQLLREMEDQVRAATEAEAKAMANAKSSERALQNAREKLEKMTRGAESALQHGDETTAREALEVQMKLEADILRLEAAKDVADTSLASARAAREETQNQLREIRSKKDELLTRARVVASQEKIQRTVSGPVTSSGSILDAVAAIESKVEEKESALEVRKDLAGVGSSSGSTASLERRIDELNSKAEIDRRMAALKAKVSGKTPAAKTAKGD
ncbi:MAG: PspA/IM30 family protein [Verrucomicrobia bacterium]|nr:PspA/IM30 family protein [Verrucomicrobiota bacterium]MCH8513378.1 PspA/IM30 family protein [Kiritimatiellia bacterium]